MSVRRDTDGKSVHQRLEMCGCVELESNYCIQKCKVLLFFSVTVLSVGACVSLSLCRYFEAHLAVKTEQVKQRSEGGAVVPKQPHYKVIYL